jgi:sulfite exporter TauE/SafE
MNYEAFKDWFFNIAGVVIIWIGLHYVTANLYPKFCAELSFIGLIKSIFVATSPYCTAMRWIIYNGGANISTMWASIGLWVTGNVFKKYVTK